MCDLFGEDSLQEVLVGPLFLLGTRNEGAPGATSIGEMKSFEGKVSPHPVVT